MNKGPLKKTKIDNNDPFNGITTDKTEIAENQREWFKNQFSSNDLVNRKINKFDLFTHEEVLNAIGHKPWPEKAPGGDGIIQSFLDMTRLK